MLSTLSSPSESSPTEQTALTGGCLCGGVSFTIKEGTKLRPLIACHCEQCRKTSGSFVIATKIKSSTLSYSKSETLVWYTSSEWAQRGFCSRCGSLLFYQRQRNEDGNAIDASDHCLSVMLGALNNCETLPFVGHIFAAQAHPSLEKLSSSPRCVRWDEKPLIDALQHAGWITDNIRQA